MLWLSIAVRSHHTMSAVIRHCVTVFTVLLLAAGCGQQSRTTQTGAQAARPDGARLSQAEVIRIATQAAERDGFRIADYKQPEAHYEFTRKDRSWTVFFDGRVAMPGNHFGVHVNDLTGETQIHRGR
jgi:hypothetical protein